MKKFLALVLAIVVMAMAASAMAVSADLTFQSQETGTAGYTYATTIMGVIQSAYPEISISLGAGSDGNVTSPVLLENEDSDLVISNAAPAKFLYETGMESLGLGQCPSIAAIAGGLGNDFTNIMFTQKFVDETGITTIEELIEKKYPVKLVIKKNGSFGELTAEKVLEALGVTFADIESWGGHVEKTGGGSIKDGLMDDLYDMTIDHIGAGQANTTELCMNHAMYDVQMSDELMDKLCTMGYVRTTVPAGTWKGQDVDIITVGSQQNLLVRADMDEEVAYCITKALCEGTEALKEGSASMGYFNPEIAGSMGLTGCPLHPGAARYYTEMGYACGE